MSRPATPPAWIPESCKSIFKPGNNAVIVAAGAIRCMKNTLKAKFLELTGQADFEVADLDEETISLMSTKNFDASFKSLESKLQSRGVRSFKLAEFAAIASKLKRALQMSNSLTKKNNNNNNNNGTRGGKRARKVRGTRRGSRRA